MIIIKTGEKLGTSLYFCKKRLNTAFACFCVDSGQESYGHQCMPVQSCKCCMEWNMSGDLNIELDA